MPKRKLIIFGMSNFAKTVFYLFEQQAHYDVTHFCVDAPYLTSTSFLNRPVITKDEAFEHCPPSDYDAFVAVGISDLNRLREIKVKEFKARGYQLASIISDFASVHSTVLLGENSAVMEGCVIQPEVTISPNTQLWPGSIIGLGSQVGGNSWLVRATLGEQVMLGNNTFLGVGAVVSPNLSIGNHVIIGAGGLATKNLAPFSVIGSGKSKPSPVNSERLKHALT